MKTLMVFLAVMALVAAGCQKKEEAPKAEAPQAAAPQAGAPSQQQQPPVAGSEVVAVGVTVDELTAVMKGWSARNQLLGKEMYNDRNEKVGKISDLIVAPDKAVTYAIVAAGGFLGIDKHDVAIPFKQIKMDQGKIILPGATKDAIKAIPPFNYAK
jgi:sporulation protein YlmC with PRC-barrel domain